MAGRRWAGRLAYRPFAPVLRARDVAIWFERPQASPSMSMTLPWWAERRAAVPAVVHADGTGRLQPVTPGPNPRMPELIEGRERLTGVPVVLKTGFNFMGKPMADGLDDAFAVLCGTGLDAVLIGDLLVRRPAAAGRAGSARGAQRGGAVVARRTSEVSST